MRGRLKPASLEHSKCYPNWLIKLEIAAMCISVQVTSDRTLSSKASLFGDASQRLRLGRRHIAVFVVSEAISLSMKQLPGRHPPVQFQRVHFWNFLSQGETCRQLLRRCVTQRMLCLIHCATVTAEIVGSSCRNSANRKPVSVSLNEDRCHFEPRNRWSARKNSVPERTSGRSKQRLQCTPCRKDTSICNTAGTALMLWHTLSFLLQSFRIFQDMGNIL